MKPRPRPAPDEVLALFESKYIPVPGSVCWLWTGTLNDSGYGQMWVNGKVPKAHRLSWELHRGPIPSGIFVCHKCDTPSCVNPEHLFLGTHSQNMVDMVRKGRGNGCVGEKHGNARLTSEQVRAIRRCGGNYTAVGRQYGVNPTTIRNIRLGINWRHLP